MLQDTKTPLPPRSKRYVCHGEILPEKERAFAEHCALPCKETYFKILKGVFPATGILKPGKRL